MKEYPSHRHRALLALLSVTFGPCAALAQKPESPSPTADIEKSDPFQKSAADAVARSTTEPSAEMLHVQAQVLFARGETEKAIRLQKDAVVKAEQTLAKAIENLARYQGRPVTDGPIARKLREIIIPIIDFEDTTLEEAVDFLRLRCMELDANESDPAKKGVNFVVAPLQELAPVDPFAEGTPGAVVKGPRIGALRLRSVPLGEVLKYICQATGTRFEIDDHAVNIVRDAP
jgi:hypothetical protein